MTATFSESSRLLVENWDIVKEIHKSEAELGGELRDFLYSLEKRLAEFPWWDGQWIFQRYGDAQIYITRTEWKRGTEYALWIGIEQFTAEALFGTDSVARLYMWVTVGSADRVTPLREFLARRKDLPDELSTKSDRYVVSSLLRKCLPEEFNEFEKVVGEPILRFFDYYGCLHQDFTALLIGQST